MSNPLLQAMLLPLLCGGMVDAFRPKEKLDPKLIRSEYALIRQKKSMLSRSQREAVCFAFERLGPVEDN